MNGHYMSKNDTYASIDLISLTEVDSTVIISMVSDSRIGNILSTEPVILSVIIVHGKETGIATTMPSGVVRTNIIQAVKGLRTQLQRKERVPTTII
jgi:hypothetical protein